MSIPSFFPHGVYNDSQTEEVLVAWIYLPITDDKASQDQESSSSGDFSKNWTLNDNIILRSGYKMMNHKAAKLQNGDYY